MATPAPVPDSYSSLAERRAYWLTRLLREHGWRAPDLARHAGLAPRAGGQLLREWAKTGAQPRDATTEAVARALSVDPGVFHSPFHEGST